MLQLDLDWICTTCFETNGYSRFECTDCGCDIEDCQCMPDDEADEVRVRCCGCGMVTFVDINDIMPDYNTKDEDEDYDDMNISELVGDGVKSVTKGLTSVTGGKSTKTTSTTPAKPAEPRIDIPDGRHCRHYNQPLTFPSGTTVFASSNHTRPATEEGPDFSVYLDSMWRPRGLAMFIDWKDYGLPYQWDTAVLALVTMWKYAKQGLWTEVGCIGGHGRTGTALACLGVLDGMTPEESLAFVRENYCHKAAETGDQVWFISWFATYIAGGEIHGEEVWDKDAPGIGPSEGVYKSGKNKGEPKPPKKGAFVPGPLYKYETPFDWEAWDITQTARCKPVHEPELVSEPRWKSVVISEFDKMVKDKKFTKQQLADIKDRVENPPKKVITGSTGAHTCQIADHKTMWMDGHDICPVLPGTCDYWEADVKEFLEGKHNADGTKRKVLSAKAKAAVDAAAAKAKPVKAASTNPLSGITDKLQLIGADEEPF